jgi:hypothetical protein
MTAHNNGGQVDCQLTFQQVAEILTRQGYATTGKVAWHLERRALKKLAEDPLIRQIAEDMGLLVLPKKHPENQSCSARH